MAGSNNSAHELDEGAWVHILKRLPIKIICRFRCVCKSWKSLITSSFFTNHHFSFTSSSNCSNKPYILFNYVRSRMFPVAYENKLILSYAFCTPPTIVKNLEFLRCPFQLAHHKLDFQLAGVLHGIVCLSGIRNSNTVLWNPTIHKYFIIPPSPYTSFLRRSDERCSGFGFDSFKNNFKVVRVFNPNGYYVMCEVFSFRQGLWRSVTADHIMPFSHTTKPSTFHNGFIHWIIKRQFRPPPMMLVFDCEREELKTMDLPPEFNQQTDSFEPFLLDTYCGMLSVVGLRTLSNIGQSQAGMWVMEEYGVASSWKKLTTVDGRDIVDIHQTSISRLVDSNGSFGEKIEDTTIKRTHRLLNGHIFEPSMFLMDENTKVESYTMRRRAYGWVSYIKDGTHSDYIKVPLR